MNIYYCLVLFILKINVVHHLLAENVQLCQCYCAENSKSIYFSSPTHILYTFLDTGLYFLQKIIYATSMLVIHIQKLEENNFTFQLK